MLLRKRKAQSTAEYAITIGIVVAIVSLGAAQDSDTSDRDAASRR